jgi:YVTN family beta-propeller protein
MKKQFGEEIPPASQEADVEVAEENMANKSIKKLQKVCRNTVIAVMTAAEIVQNEAVQWTAKVGGWSKQEVENAEIVSQTDSQMGESLAQVRQIIARVENRARSLPADIVSLVGTSLIEVKNLIEAIVEMKQILTLVDYRQAKLEAKQATESAKKAKIVAADTAAEEIVARVRFWDGSAIAIAIAEAKEKTAEARETAKEKAKEAEQANRVVEQAKVAFGKEPVGAAKKMRSAILATNDTLQRTVAQLKQVYFKQMEATAAAAELTRTEAKKWMAAKAKDPLQIENWLRQMHLICEAIKEMLRQKVVQAITQNAEKVDIDSRLYEVEKNLTQIQTDYVAEIATMKEAWIVAQDEATREREAAMIVKAETEAKMRIAAENRVKTEIATMKEAWIAARNEATREMEVAMAAKAEIEAKKKIAAEIRAKMGEMLYVVNKGSDVVSVIATATQEIMETLQVGKSPQRLAVTPDRTRILITNAGDDTVSTIDTVTHETIAVLSVGNRPLGIAIHPDGTKAYVANYGSGTVSVLDLQTNRVSEIRVGDSPVSVAFVYGGVRAFVANSLSQTISVIDEATQRVIREIRLPDKSPEGVAVAPDGKKAYVTNEQSDTITVINVVNNKITAKIQVGHGPTEIAITADGTRAYVVNSRSDNVSVVNIAADPPTIVATVAVGDHPVGIAFSGDGMCAYVSNENDDGISVIDTDTFAVQDSILVGQSPAGMATATWMGGLVEEKAREVEEIKEAIEAEREARRVAEAKFKEEVEALKEAIEAEREARRVVEAKLLAVEKRKQRVVGAEKIAEQGRVAEEADRKAKAAVERAKLGAEIRKVKGVYAYVVNLGSDSVSVIDTDIQKVLITIPVEEYPRGVAITPDGSRAYVANLGSDNVSVIDIDIQKVLITIPVEEYPRGVAITPDGSQAYVVNLGSDSVSVIDTATQKILATISVGKYPQGVAIIPDGSRAYVANLGSDNVSVIDTATQKVLDIIPVGQYPCAIAVASIPLVKRT